MTLDSFSLTLYYIIIAFIHLPLQYVHCYRLIDWCTRVYLWMVRHTVYLWMVRHTVIVKTQVYLWMVRHTVIVKTQVYLWMVRHSVIVKTWVYLWTVRHTVIVKTQVYLFYPASLSQSLHNKLLFFYLLLRL